MHIFKNSLVLILLSLITGISYGQTTLDKASIDQLCGCFAVTFNYAETFTNDTNNTFKSHPRDQRSVVEYEYPMINTPKKVVIQHILVVPGGHVIKHWREDWEFEKTTQWQYVKDHRWKKVERSPADVKGTWTQSVWEVTDAPRYMGAGKWVELNQEVFWLNTTDAPLPRREYTTRHDYNVMNRTNRIVVSELGYIHEQDNNKIIRTDQQPDSLLAEEKGYNNYVRISDTTCAAAKAFWTPAKAAFWTNVRSIWDDVLSKADRIQLETKVDGKYLYQSLGQLENQWMDKENKSKDTSLRKSAIQKVMKSYIHSM